MPVDPLPILGDARRHPAENMRCQVFDAHPGQNQVPAIVSDEPDVAPPGFRVPTNVAIATA